MEPDWGEVRARLMAMPMRKLRPIGSSCLGGMLGGASTKAEYVAEMVSQMSHCWRNDARAIAERALAAIDEAERG